MIGAIDKIINSVGTTGDKLFTSDEERLQARNVLAKLKEGLASGVIKLNAIDASSSDVFQSRWRPFIGWVCGIGWATNIIAIPLIELISQLLGSPVSVMLDTSQLMALTSAMLGMGALRHFDKKK